GGGGKGEGGGGGGGGGRGGDGAGVRGRVPPDARTRAHLVLRDVDPAHPARRAGGAGRGPVDRVRGPADGRQRGRGDAARPPRPPRRERAADDRAAGLSRERAVPVRVGQPGRAVLGPLDDRRGRAPRGRRRSRRHGGALLA